MDFAEIDACVTSCVVTSGNLNDSVDLDLIDNQSEKHGSRFGPLTALICHSWLMGAYDSTFAMLGRVTLNPVGILGLVKSSRRAKQSRHHTEAIYFARSF